MKRRPRQRFGARVRARGNLGVGTYEPGEGTRKEGRENEDRDRKGSAMVLSGLYLGQG